MPPRRRQHDALYLPRRGRATAAVAGVAAAIALLAGGPVTRAADPCTISWDGGAGTDRWFDDANWTGDRQPGTSDLACIGVGRRVTFGILNETIAGLRVEGSLTMVANDLHVAGTSASEVTGSLTLEGGRLELRGGAVPVALFRHSGGQLYGSGSIRTADLRWTGGSETGSGTTEVEPGGPGLELSGGGRTLDDTRRLRIDAGASAAWTAGDLELRDHSSVDNAGLLDIRGDQDLIGYGAVETAVVNEAGATLRKSAGDGTTRLTYPMANDGDLDLRTGALSIENGSVPGRASSGSFEVGDGATLVFAAGITGLDSDSSVTGHGTGEVRFTGGSTRLAGRVDAAVAVDGPAAYAFFESPVLLPRVRLARGFLGGDGAIATPELAWTGGSEMIGGGPTRIVPGGPGLAISGDGNHVLNGRRLEVAADATADWTAGALVLLDVAAIENAGLFDVRGDLALRLAGFCCDSRPEIHNVAGGTFRKSAGAGRATVGYRFRNDGTLEAAAGTLDLAGGLESFSGGTLGGGRYVVSATLAFANAYVTSNAASVVLDGPASRIEDSFGGDALRDLGSNLAGGALTLTGGRSIAPAGDLANAGTLTLADGATLAPAGAFNQAGGVTGFDAPDAVLRPGAGADLAGGLLRGSGTVDGDLTNGAVVEPDLEPDLTVTGDYVQTSAGTLVAPILDPTRHSRLDVGRRAQLAGALRLETLIGYVPDPGDEIELVRHSSEDGEFDQVDGIEPVPGHAYSPPDYDPAGVWLRPGSVPSVSIGDATATEGDHGDATATFRVSVDPTPTRTVRVDWSTRDGTATAPADYDPAGGTVTIPHGRGTAEIQVPVHGDLADEPDERFAVELSSASNATIAGASGTGTILDDDQPGTKPPPVKPPPVKPPPVKPPPTRPPHTGPPPAKHPRRCRDRLVPRSSVRRPKLRHRRLRLRGTARDRGCAGLARVSVSVALHRHHRCRFLKRNGRLGKPVSCRRQRWIRARGKAHWRLRPKRRLARGRYTVRTRAIDRAGNREKRRTRRNARTFRLR